MKIVINTEYGGYTLSKKAVDFLRTRGVTPECKRNDPALIECVTILGEEANESYSKLKIVEIPDDVDWEIEEYDGKEWVSEAHRTWS